MVNWHDIKFALGCTAENLYIILPVLLVSGAAAFFAGSAVRRRAKSTAICLFPLILAELALFLVMFPHLVRWVDIQSFTWGFWYEGGLDFYLPFSAMIGILVGYPLAFRKKARVR